MRLMMTPNLDLKADASIPPYCSPTSSFSLRQSKCSTTRTPFVSRKSFCQLAETAIVQTTDLSLAKHVVIVFGALPESESSLTSHAHNLASLSAFTGLSVISPKICTATIYMITDDAKDPTSMLFSFKSALDILPLFDSCEFDGVGSIVAQVHGNPDFKLVVQYKAMMQHWAECASDDMPQEPVRLSATSANALSRFVTAKPQSTYTTTIGAGLIAAFSKAHPAVELNSLAFWTFAEFVMHSRLVRGGRGQF